MTQYNNGPNAGKTRNQKWLVLALAVVGVLVASGLKNSFGAGRSRDYMPPETLRTAFDAGEHVGQADIAAKRFDELSVDLAKAESARLALTDGQRRAWCEAFATGYRAALQKEIRRREQAQRR